MAKEEPHVYIVICRQVETAQNRNLARDTPYYQHQENLTVGYLHSRLVVIDSQVQHFLPRRRPKATLH